MSVEQLAGAVMELQQELLTLKTEKEKKKSS